MKKEAKIMLQRGFTLIELIIVIAILAFVTTAAIKGYGNIREIQAKKVNLANIKRLSHSLATYEAIHLEAGSTGFFNYFDSICDADASGPNGQQTGTPGTAKWCSVAESGALKSNTPGIYDGSWKYLAAVKNRAGVGSDTAPTYETARNQNFGTTSTGLNASLGVYYLTAAEATALKNAGINTILYHNPSTSQSSAYFSPTNMGDGVSFGGGPGFRPDMSAYCPCQIQEGAAVAMIVPGTVSGENDTYTSDSGATTIDASAYNKLSADEKGEYKSWQQTYTFTGSSIYSDFGYPVASVASQTTTNVVKTVADFAKLSTKLFVFGIGRSAECVRNKIGLGEAPYNPFYSKQNYRQYLAVFAYVPGGQGVANSCHFVGCLDCAGNTYKQAEYSMNWTTELR